MDTPKVLSATARVTLGEAVSEKGVLIAIKTTDAKAYKAADAANLRVIGITEDVGDAGDKIVAQSGIYLLENDSVSAVTQAHIGANCYVKNEKTVSSASGTNSIVAGKVVDVVSQGVWVAVGIV